MPFGRPPVERRRADSRQRRPSREGKALTRIRPAGLPLAMLAPPCSTGKETRNGMRTCASCCPTHRARIRPARRLQNADAAMGCPHRRNEVAAHRRNCVGTSNTI